uniref:Clavesin-2 n=1 Tax=Cacopsylla melanoneura TaxID=428564 RepID=A0A8D8VSK6_9HEMI
MVKHEAEEEWDSLGEVCYPNPDPLDIDKDWMLKAEMELHETPEIARNNMKALKDLLLSDPNLHSRTDDVFLMAFLRARKHDVDKTYSLIKGFYEMKLKAPEFYRDCLPSERRHIYDMDFFAMLPTCDRLGRKVCVLYPGKMDFSKISLEEVFQIGTTVFEIALCDPTLQISGAVCIIDMCDFGVYQQAKLATPKCAWQISNCIQEKIPLRVKAIHIVNQPFYFNALYAIFKPFLKQKLRRRINLHGTSMKSLHKHIAPECLPQEWGGKLPPYNAKPMTKLVLQHEDKLINWRQYGYKKEIKN